MKYETHVRSGSTKTQREVIEDQVTRESYNFEISEKVYYSDASISDLKLTLTENMRGPMQDVDTWEWECIETEQNPGLPLLAIAAVPLSPLFMVISEGELSLGDVIAAAFGEYEKKNSTTGPWIIGRGDRKEVPASTEGCNVDEPRAVKPADEIWQKTQPADNERIFLKVHVKPESVFESTDVVPALTTDANGTAKFSMTDLYKAMKGPPSEVRVNFVPQNAPDLVRVRLDTGSAPTTFYRVVQEIKFQERERKYEKTHEQSLAELLSLKKTYEKELKRGEFESREAYQDRIAEVRRENLANIDSLSQNLRSTIQLGRYDPDAELFPMEFSNDLSPMAKNRKYVAKVPLPVARQVKEEQGEFRFRPFVDSNSELEVAIAGGVIENRRTGESYEVSWYAEGGKLPQRTANLRLGTGTPQGVAIYPFRASGGAEPAFAEGITSLFESSLAGQSKCVRIVGEDVIEDLAKQMALEQQCGTESCQIDLASAAKAEFMIRGDLTKLGRKYYLTATLIDLATKETLGSNKVESNESEVAVKAEQLARAISGTIGCN